MKKTLLFVPIAIGMLMLATNLCYAQDSTAIINTSWQGYANNTSLTYRQIITTCDSLFALAGYTDTMHSEEDGSSFVNYQRWKNFWSTRCDVATGKLHSFAADAIAALTTVPHGPHGSAYLSRSTGGGSSGGSHGVFFPGPGCAGTSILQGNTVLIPSTAPGWTWVGPQNIVVSTMSYEGCGNSLHQHIGQVNGIVVNPANHSEVYATDAWGGIWKTTNANLAPNNTWGCLTDNLPYFPGIGITNLHVEFASTPGGHNQLFCLAGIPWSLCMANITNYDPHTVGIYYSLDDGNNFQVLSLPSTLNLAIDPILDMEYWPGNATSPIRKYLFVTTVYQIYRVEITDINAPVWKVMKDMYPIVSIDDPAERFRGFREIRFLPADPTVMYASTFSNDGFDYSATGGLYRIPNCTTCTYCTLTGITLATPSDFLNYTGQFNLANFPGQSYPGWWSSSQPTCATCTPIYDWSQNAAPANHIECKPPLYPPAGTGYACSAEVAVDGSYLDNITYQISFTVSLPPNTEMDVVLKDVKDANIYSVDWGYGTTPSTLGDFTGNFPVGTGYNSGFPGPTAGKYVNNTISTYTTTVIATVTANHYVCRLEFATWALNTSYTGATPVTLSNVSVVQPYEKYIGNLATTSASSAAHNIYCYTNNAASNNISIVTDNMGAISTASFTCNVTTNQFNNTFQISAVNPNWIYEYAWQTPSCTGLLYKLDITNPAAPVTYNDGNIAEAALHADARSMDVISVGGADKLYFGGDGGIAEGSFSGPWTSLNGTGMKTSWGFDIGSSIHTGEVSIAATDNSLMVSNQKDFTNWTFYYVGDGGQTKYGKRYATSNVWFLGSSNGSGFDKLDMGHPLSYNGGAPASASLDELVVRALPLSKLVTTNNNEYVGQGFGPNSLQQYTDDIYDVKAALTTGPVTPTYNLAFVKITTDASYSVHEPVQAIAPDMYDPNYIAAYMHTAPWDAGYFAYSTDLTTSVTPTWTLKKNSPASFNCLVADPRSAPTAKILWAGAGGYYTNSLSISVPDIGRVYKTADGGASWTDMSTGLPAGPVNVLVYDEQSYYLFAGTDQGVYAFNVLNGPITPTNYWQCYSLNLPSSFITGLDINRCTGKLYASTYGRGAYEADLPPEVNVGGSGPGGVTDVGDFDYISTTTTWWEGMDETRNIYIPSGVTLTISGCTVNMGKDKKIVVAQGGKLVVSGSTITNGCGSMWYGICPLGNVYAGQTPANDGWVTITNSTIENARNAVSNGNTWIGSATSGWLGGGVVQASGSTFLNNQTAVDFYHYTNGSSPDLSNFTNCNFIIDNNYIGTPLGYPFAHHAYLYEVQGVNFNGCKFTNRNTNYGAARGYGEGIVSQDASFNVGIYCSTHTVTCPSPVYSRFSRFTNGIDIQNIIGATPTISIDQALFDTISVGVYGSDYNNISATRCNFTIGHGNGVQATRSTDFTGCNQNIGIFLQNIPQFQMEGNTFTGTTPVVNWYNFGTVVANTCQASGSTVPGGISGSTILTNTVYRNTFNGLTEGVYAIGCNHGGLAAVSTGLEILCNTFNNNTNDIYVVGDGNYYGPYHPQGIAEYQVGGVSSYHYIPAGNTFSGSTHNIVNTSGNGLVYYYDGTTSQDPVNILASGTSGVSVYSSYPLTNSCPSSFPGPIRTPVAPVALDQSVLQTYKQTFRSASVAYEDSLAVYDSMIVNSTSTPLYPTLLAKSPWMAQTALQGVADGRTLTYSQFINVLKQNASVYRDPDFRNYVQSDYAITTADKDSLVQKSTQSTRRTNLEASIISSNMIMSEAANKIMMALKTANDTSVSVSDTTGAGICTDSTSMYYGLDSNMRYASTDSVNAWLQNIGSLWTWYSRVGLYNSAHQYSKADSIFHTINYVVPTGLSIDRTTYDTYTRIWNVIHGAEVAGRDMHQLTNHEIFLLDTTSVPIITYNSAEQVLRNITAVIKPAPDPQVNPCLPIQVRGSFARNGDGSDSQNAVQPPVTDINDYTSNCRFSVYPNPASGIVTFEYNVPDPGEDITITISNILGEKVQVIYTGNSAGRVYWDPRKAASGVYLYQASDANGIISKGKILITTN